MWGVIMVGMQLCRSSKTRQETKANNIRNTGGILHPVTITETKRHDNQSAKQALRGMDTIHQLAILINKENKREEWIIQSLHLAPYHVKVSP